METGMVMEHHLKRNLINAGFLLVAFMAGFLGLKKWSFPNRIDSGFPRFYSQFTLDTEEFKDHPIIQQAVYDALHMWEEAAQVKLQIIIDQNSTNYVHIHVVDIQTNPAFEFNRNAVGVFWVGSLWLDDDLDKGPGLAIGSYALATCLHELGHYLGLPHIVGYDTPNIKNGDIIVGSDLEARQYIMYPSMPISATKIHPYEASLVSRMVSLNANFECGLGNH